MSSSDKKSRPSDEAEIRGYASPPCYQHELDPDYLGTTGWEGAEQPGTDSSWTAIRAWRAKTRSRLIEVRKGLTNDDRTRRASKIIRSCRVPAR